MNTQRIPRSNSRLILLLVVMVTTATYAADTVIHFFAGSPSDGATPYTCSLMPSGSRLYGMTYKGGSFSNGTVFALNSNGTAHNVMHHFAGPPNDGSYPVGAFVQIDSALYGTTSSGGKYTNAFFSGGNGTVFTINTNGTGYTILHDFGSTLADGNLPYAALTLAGGALYGTTAVGGNYTNGTIFVINADGSSYAVLHHFVGSKPIEGGSVSALTISDATLYGTKEVGGIYSNGYVFSMNTNGTGYTILHHFGSAAGDGSKPISSLTLVGSSLYGTTSDGGTLKNGNIFTINTDGSGYRIVHQFGAVSSDGRFPYASLTAVGSTLYGTTGGGGSYNRGTVFAVNTDGSGYSILHSFPNSTSDGNNPLASVILVGSNFYGTTDEGGITNSDPNGSGSVFTLPLPTRIIGLSGNLDFGSVAVGTTTQRALALTNTGNSELHISSISYPTGFSGPWSGSIPVGGSTNVTVSFAPTSENSYGGTLTVDSDATSGSNTLAISGTGICVYLLSLTNATVAAVASSNSFGISTGNGCAWSASTVAAWIHTSSSSAGNGNISYAVDANANSDGRTGTITTVGLKFTVTQAGNAAPQVSIAAIPSITWPVALVNLQATVTDDGSPYGTSTATWSKLSGPGTVVFGNPSAANTTATFSTNGTFVLRLTASDGALSASNDVTVIVNLAPQITSPPVITNGTATVGGVAIVQAGELLGFTVGGADADGNPLSCAWNFGDGSTSTDCNPTHSFTNCGAYPVSVAISDGIATTTTTTSVSVACAMSVTNFQAKLNFAKPNLDSCRFKATPQPGNCTNLTGVVATLDVGGVQVTFALDVKGRGVSTNGSCRLSYKKKTGECAFSASLNHGSWQSAWAGYGLVNTNYAKPGVAVTLPVTLVIGDEAFMAEKPLHYTATAGKSGLAK
jgi:uncharacterized repeat protein (TIGR03803 family)